MPLNEDTFREEFHRLSDEKEALVIQAKPFRDEYDRISKQMGKLRDAKLAQAVKFKPIEKKVFDIDRQLGMINRALKGKTGPRPKKAEAKK